MQRMLIAYILTGLLFLLLPGTFLGVWNLISISSRHALDSLSPPFCKLMGTLRFSDGSGRSSWASGFIL